MTLRTRTHARIRTTLPWLATGVAALLLPGCAAPPPADRLLRLPLASGEPAPGTPPDTSPGTPAADTARAGAAAPTWQLMPLAALPDPLERDAVLVADGAAGLRPLPGVRWAEPLRDALPRLLLADLLRLRGPGSVWAAPLPPGLTAPQQLRVQLLALDNLPAAGLVRLQARWSLADAGGRQPPQAWEAALSQPWPGGGADALALAQRALLAQLARRIAASALPGP